MAMQGDELKAVRTKLGMTQDAFAEAMGMTRVFIGMMERGDRPISPETERKARFLRTCGDSNTIFNMALRCQRAARNEDRLDSDDLEQIAEWLLQLAPLPKDW